MRALLLATLVAVGIHPPAPIAIGHSVQGRPIELTRVGDPAAARKILVVGEVHGDERAGRGIVNALRRATPPADTQLLLVRDLNPDGFVHHTRTNAHGIDLNRNSPQGWAGAGPRPWSEPETRALRRLVLRARPALTIYYHQPFGLIDPPERGSAAAARAYARLSGLPLRNLALRPGSLSRWQNARVRPGSAFVVELPPGPLLPRERRVNAAAVLALAAQALAR
jgi:murein peptide amidase A